MTRILLGTVTLVSLLGTACDRSTGPAQGSPRKELWIAPPDANWQPAADDSAVYFKTSEHGVISVSRSTGAVRWTASTNATTGSAYGRNIVISGSEVVVPDYRIFAFNRITGALDWTFDPTTQGAPGFAPGAYGIAGDSVIFAGSGSGHVYAIDAGTGQLRWVTQLATDGNSSVFDPVLEDSCVYVHVTHFTNPLTGELVALDRRTGTVIWSRSFVPTVTSASDIVSVAVYDSLVIASVEDGTVRAVDKTTGADRWTAPRLADTPARDDQRNIVVAGGVVVAGSEALDVTGYDAKTGRQLWQTNAKQGSSISPLATDGSSVYVVYANGNLAALDASTGALRWLAGVPTGPLDFLPFPLATTQAVYAPSASGLFALRP